MLVSASRKRVAAPSTGGQNARDSAPEPSAGVRAKDTPPPCPEVEAPRKSGQSETESKFELSALGSPCRE
jgi:hypothetical protein